MVWLDVSKEPWIFSIPDMGDRYYMAPMLDAWTNVFQSPDPAPPAIEPRSTTITGPRWSGTLPGDVTEYKSPSGSVWILGRIYCTGTPEDYAKAHELQDGFSVVPLSSYRQAVSPPPATVDPTLNMKTGTREQVQEIDIESYFRYLAALLKTNPPLPKDGPIRADGANRIDAGQDFDPGKLNAADREGLKAVPNLDWPSRRSDERTAAGERMADLRLERRQLWHRLSSARDDRVARPRMESS